MMEFLNMGMATELPDIQNIVVGTVLSLLFGLFIAMIYMFKNKYSRSMVMTLVLLPAIVQIIIMLINGNIGVGVSVAGAFSLVRFRSISGTAKEIGTLFFAMAIGFVMGLGFILYAFIFLVLIGSVYLLLTQFAFGESEGIRTLKIKIPEDLDYEYIFDDIFQKYLRSCELIRVKTSNMGSLFELTYVVRFRLSSTSKQFIDEIRCRNGNLNITLSRSNTDGEEL